MGKLLSSAIKMQGSVAVANPTLTITWTEGGTGGSTDVYKNGFYFGSPTPSVAFNVPIVAGDAFYVVVNSEFNGSASYNYFVNGSNIASDFVINGAVVSATYTASGTNAYSFTTATLPPFGPPPEL